MNPLSVYKAMADETRLKSLLLIYLKRELCVCDLMHGLTLSQPKVSRHLAELRKSGLVSTDRRGKWVYYQLNNALPSWVLTVIEATVSGHPELIEQELVLVANSNC